MIRILLVDDQALLCEVLKTWLEVEKDFQVVGIADNGETAIEKVEALQPDIVLIDIEMPGMNGLNATSIICQRHPHVKVIVLSAHDDDTYLGKSLRAGAQGYILKNTTAEDLAAQIRSIYNGDNQVIAAGANGNYGNLDRIKAQIVEEIIHKVQEQGEISKLNGSNGQLQENFDRRLSQLQNASESTWKEIRNELVNAQSKFSDANRTLNSQMNQQLVNLKKDLEAQLTHTLDDWSKERTALQEWAVQRDEMRPSFDELELKFRNELMAVINPIRASVRDMNKQVRIMRNGLVVAILTAAMALTFSGWVFVSKTDSAQNQSKETPEQLN